MEKNSNRARFRASVITHRDHLSEIRIIPGTPAGLIKYDLIEGRASNVRPPEEYPNTLEAIRAGFGWIRHQFLTDQKEV